MNSNNKLKVISRSSPLSIIQVGELFSHFSTPVDYELETCLSMGDKDLKISLMETLNGDFFTRELDEAIFSGKADVSIHSAKDLPYPLPQGLEVIALTQAFENRDALVVRQGMPQTLADLPVGAVVATSSPMRKQELLQLRPDLKVKSVRGTIEQRIEQVDEGKYDALIVAACALKRLKLDNRLSEYLPFRTHPLQGALAVVALKSRNDLKELFSAIDVRPKFGKVTLVGFGTGDPGLLTCRGLEKLEQADSIVYDDLTNQDFLKKFDAELIYAGKRIGCHHMEQEEINHLLLSLAIKGKKTVRLKGGDGMLFAHGGEEITYLESNMITTEVVPGITTGCALSATSKIPLTHRGISSSVTFISGHNANSMNFPTADTVVVYMGGSQIKKIADKLLSTGHKADEKVLVVSSIGGEAEQESICTLAQLSAQQQTFPTPVAFMFGKVVELRYKSAKEIMYENKILFTGLDANPYKHLGTIVHTPLIGISDIDHSNLKLNIDDSNRYQYLLFTSRNTVKHFFEALQSSGKDSRVLNGLKIVSIGRITSAELNKYGIQPDVQADVETSEGIVDTFRALEIGKVLVPRSKMALNIIPTGLTELGFEVTTVDAYDNVMPWDAVSLDLSTIGSIFFTSPSTVDNFMSLYKHIPQNKKFIARGKTTYNRLCQLEFPIHKISIYDERV